MQQKKSQLRGRPALHRREEVGNRTVLVGIRLLQMVAQASGPGTLTEIAKRTGMSPSRTYRYLASLTQAGFLEQDPGTGRYDLGPAAIELGISATARLDPIRMASDLMSDLTDTVGLVSILSVWGSNGPTVIRAEVGRLETAIHVREGTNVSTVTTSVGRIFLAYMPAEEISALADRHRKEWNAAAPKPKRITAAEMEKLRGDVRAHGLSCAIGLRNPSIAALAAPVFGPNGRLSMCVALMGIIGSFDTGFEGRPATELKKTAERLSRLLGGPGIGIAGALRHSAPEGIDAAKGDAK